MKHIVARAMILHHEHMEGQVLEKQEINKEKDPVYAELLKEITSIQIQTYQNNLAVRRIEQTLTPIKWKLEQRHELPDPSVKALVPIASFDED